MTVAMPGLPPPHPIPIKDRSSILFLEKGRLDVLDGAFVLVDEAGVRLHIPVGGMVCLISNPALVYLMPQWHWLRVPAHC
jgi:CRISP-associated protein Cas1